MEWKTRGVPCAAVLCASMMLGGRIRFVIIFCAYVFPKYSAWKVHLPWNLKDLSDFVPGISKYVKMQKKRKVLQSQLLHGSGMLTRTSQQTFFTQTVSWQFSIAMRSILTYPRLCPVLRGLFYITHRKAAPKEGAPASEDEAVFRFKAVYLLHLVIFNVFTCMVLWCFVSWSVCESSCFTRFCSFQSCEVKDVVIPEETLIFLKARVPHVRTITCLWLSKEFESIHSRDVEWGISYWELETPLRH